MKVASNIEHPKFLELFRKPIKSILSLQQIQYRPTYPHLWKVPKLKMLYRCLTLNRRFLLVHQQVLLQPYGFAVDVWACACVIAECFLGTCKEVVEHREGRRPLFPGRSCFPLSPAAGGRGGWHQKNDQLQAIFRVRGTPTPAEIDSLEHDYKGMKAYDLDVPRCCGAFTPSTRLVFIRRGSRWFLFRV